MTESLPELPAAVRFQHTGATARLRIAPRGQPGAWLLTLWLILWSYACFTVAKVALETQDIRLVLALIPFGLAWYLGLAAWLFVCHRRSVIELSPEGLIYRAFVGPVTTTEGTIAIAQVRSFRTVYERHEDEDGVNEQWLVVPDSLGPRWPLFESKVQAEGDSVATALNRILAAVRPMAPDRFEADLLGSSWPTEPLPITRSDASLSLKPPAHWEQSEEGIEFKLRWCQSVGGLAGINLAACALFWNSLVGFLVYGVLTSGASPKLLLVYSLFLVLFVLVGLLLVGAAVGLLVPGWIRRWLGVRDKTFEQGYCWGPYVWQKYWPLSEISAVELRPGCKPVVPGAWQSESTATEFKRGPYHLALVDTKGNALTYVGDLHEGEARWLGEQLATALELAPEPAVVSA